MRFHWFKQPDPPEKTTEGRKARERAVQSMAYVDARWDEVSALGEELRQIHQRNHFAETITRIFKEHR